MPSPQQKPMRPPPNMTAPSPVPVQPGPSGNPMMRTLTPQAMQQPGGAGQPPPGHQVFPPGHPQHGGPITQSPAPMTPHQQMMQVQAMQRGMMDAQGYTQGPMQGQQQMPMGMPNGPGGSGGPGGPNGVPTGPNGVGMTKEQLQAMQAQQMNATVNNMYAPLGLGPVNSQVMQNSALSLGLQGRDPTSLGEEERVSYTATDI